MREQRKVSLGNMAKHIGVSGAYLSDVERGNRRSLTLDKIRRVRVILGLSFEEEQLLISARILDAGEVSFPYCPTLLPQGDQEALSFFSLLSAFPTVVHSEVARKMKRVLGARLESGGSRE